MVLVVPTELAELRQMTNEGPGFTVVPAARYKRATRLCMLAAEMLFSQSFGCTPQTANGSARCEHGA